MANRLPNEDAMYVELKRQNVTFSEKTWDSLYSFIGEKLTAIHMLISFFSEMQLSVPREELKKVLSYTREIDNVFKEFIHPKIVKSGDNFEIVNNSNPEINPIVKALFGHYIGNDLHTINFIINCFIDDKNEEVFGVRECKKVLERIVSMKAFLDKIRFCTLKGEGWGNKIRNKIQFPLEYTQLLLEDPKRYSREDLEKALKCLKDIAHLIEKVN